ncbi:unnamed protein product, partial [Medioppia subpectinata]
MRMNVCNEWTQIYFPNFWSALQSKDTEELVREMRQIKGKFSPDSDGVSDLKTCHRFIGRLRRQFLMALELRSKQEFAGLFGRKRSALIRLRVSDQTVYAVLDSGADSSLLGSSLARRLGLYHTIDTRRKWRRKTTGFGGEKRSVGQIHALDMELESGRGLRFPFSVIEGFGNILILGLDFLEWFQCCIDFNEKTLLSRAKPVATATAGPMVSAKGVPDLEEFLEKRDYSGAIALLQ